MPLPEQQISKTWPTSFVNARDFPIENRVLDVQMFSDPCRKLRKAAKDISISRDQLGVAVLNVGERTETINLQLEDVIIGIERLGTA